MTKERLISGHINVHTEHFNFDFWATRLTLIARDGSDHVCLDNIKPLPQQDLKYALLRELIRYRHRRWLERLHIDQCPDAVLSILKEIWEHWHNANTAVGGGYGDGGRLLHFSWMRINLNHEWSVNLHGGVRLNSKPSDERIFDSFTSVSHSAINGSLQCETNPSLCA